MILRPAEPEEYGAVGALTVAAYVADGFLDHDDDYATELRDAARRAAEAELLVAVDPTSDELAGTVTFCLHDTHYAEITRPGEAEFRMLAVAPPARRRGAGHDLISWCVERAREQGCTGLVLLSLDRMHAAHRLYERLGFQRLPDRYWSPAPGIALVAYRLALQA